MASLRGRLDRVLLQLMDILKLKTRFKYRKGSWHSSLKRLKGFGIVDEKLCSLIRYSQIFNVHAI